MDVTETYIRMCDCPEIQGQWNMRAGDWLKLRRSEYVSLAYESTARGESGFTEPDAIWLPRQDQLQQMVSNQMSWRYFDHECIEYFGSAETKEQASIQVVMREHNKAWDGGQWQSSPTSL